MLFPLRRLAVVPVRIAHKPMYMLAYHVESRNGIMIKHLTGMKPFPIEQLEGILNIIGHNALIDLRLPLARKLSHVCCGCIFYWCYGCIPDDSVRSNQQC
jgi:hypothetical protein